MTENNLTVIEIPATDEIDAEANSIKVAAEAFMVQSQAQLTNAEMFLERIKTTQDNINEAFDPSIKAAHQTHKTILAAKKKHSEPLEEAERVIKKKIGGYVEQVEAENRRLEAEAREMARQEEEDRRIEEAARLEKEGRVEQAEALIEAPPAPAPIVPQPAVQKKVSIVKVWKHRIVAPLEIPREYLMPNDQMLAGVAKSTRGALSIPGVEFYEESQVRANRKR